MGFLELLVIGVIALIVLGPERLPKAARTVGLWIGKAKQGFNSVKNEIDRELKVQELQQQIEEQKSELEIQIKNNSLKEELSQIKNTVDETRQDLNKSAQDSLQKNDKLEIND